MQCVTVLSLQGQHLCRELHICDLLPRIFRHNGIPASTQVSHHVADCCGMTRQARACSASRQTLTQHWRSLDVRKSSLRDVAPEGVWRQLAELFSHGARDFGDFPGLGVEHDPSAAQCKHILAMQPAATCLGHPCDLLMPALCTYEPVDGGKQGSGLAGRSAGTDHPALDSALLCRACRSSGVLIEWSSLALQA